MEKIKEILNYKFSFNEDIFITVKTIIVLVLGLIVTAFLLKVIRKIVSKKLPAEDKVKFISVFGYLKWFIYVIIFLAFISSSGVQLTAVLAASAVLLIGIGMALQTLFQDIISGIFILIDQSVHVGDIIELEGKVGRVEEINLRTTRAVTIDNRVLVIPNHLYLTNSLYNWTQNGTLTRESVTVGVAYGSDINFVKKLLLQASNEHPNVIKIPEPMVLFTDFGNSSLDFRLIFTLNNSFESAVPKSDIRFKINELFATNNISIPFPQRDVHLFNN